MTNNDILRRLRYLLSFSDEDMRQIYLLEDYPLSLEKIDAYLKKDDEDGYQEMGDNDLGVFLDGLISKFRGKRPPKPGQQAERRLVPRNNNDRLKKLRIAFHLQEEDMLKVFSLGEFPLQKSEISAFFRKKGHKNYRPLGDQAFRKFLKGLQLFKQQGGLKGWSASNA